ncbi:SRPBCC family protein [Pedobacter ureilyticus]|uniref:SRPBCC family protein n=1 Tax=Pedobacter ureilyticus TaxID=1393051 RepID=A0ABW9J4D4_9SPHI|nr:SRPBCC family protein [Pedobacter helvus]
MKFLKIFLGIVVILIAIILIGSLFLPNTYSVSRSTSIAASDTTVYKNIADFNSFKQWNPWYKMEPSAKTTISGTPEQAGHLYEWVGKETGSGQMKITSVKPQEEVKIELKFIKPFESLANTQFNVAREGDSTKVTWTMSGDNNIISKWMCLVMGGMDKMIGKDFEDGLKSLKEKSEKK